MTKPTARDIDWGWDTCRTLDAGRGSTVLVRALESDTAKGTTLFVASTDTPDRAMDIVKQDWNLRNFRSNPVILDNHDYERVVGRGVQAEVAKDGRDAGSLMILVQWDLENPDPEIAAVGHQHLRGFRSAGSVGFRSGKRTERHLLPKTHPAYQEPIEVDTWCGKMPLSGWYYEKNELLEFSSATIPMNPEALQRSYGVQPPAPAATPESPALAPLDLVRAWSEAAPEQRGKLAGLLLADLRALPEFGVLVRGLVEAVPVPVNRPAPPSVAELVLSHLKRTP